MDSGAVCREHHSNYCAVSRRKIKLVAKGHSMDAGFIVTSCRQANGLEAILQRDSHHFTLPGKVITFGDAAAAALREIICSRQGHYSRFGPEIHQNRPVFVDYLYIVHADRVSEWSAASEQRRREIPK